MISVTITHKDGAAVSPNQIRPISQSMLASPFMAPSTEGDTGSVAILFVPVTVNGQTTTEKWTITGTFAATLILLTQDSAEAGSAPVASPTFTGVPAAPTAATGVITTQLATMAAVQNRLNYYAATTSGTDTYTCTLAPVPPAWVTGMEMNVKFGITNTGTATLNPNTLGAKTLKKTDGATNLAASDLVVGMLYRLFYDGTNLIVTNL